MDVDGSKKQNVFTRFKEQFREQRGADKKSRFGKRAIAGRAVF